jgi:hypothetical protein
MARGMRKVAIILVMGMMQAIMATLTVKGIRTAILVILMGLVTMRNPLLSPILNNRSKTAYTSFSSEIEVPFALQ